MLGIHNVMSSTLHRYIGAMLNLDNLDSIKQKIFFPVDKLLLFNRTVSSGLREMFFHVIFIQILFFTILISISTDIMCL